MLGRLFVQRFGIKHHSVNSSKQKLSKLQESDFFKVLRCCIRIKHYPTRLERERHVLFACFRVHAVLTAARTGGSTTARSSGLICLVALAL